MGYSGRLGLLHAAIALQAQIAQRDRDVLEDAPEYSLEELAEMRAARSRIANVEPEPDERPKSRQVRRAEARAARKAR